jgi:mannitol-1-phosphate 5-dehydrogenase
MALTGTRTYVGFGFGAIQSGLFLYEAFRSGAFRRLVVAEVLPKVVAAVRRAEGHYFVNIAYPDRVERAEVGPIEIEDPASEPDRQRLVEAIAEAEEIGTAIPSVEHYVSAKPASIHSILAAGLSQKADRGGPRAIVYAAENHNHAAEILESQVWNEIPESHRGAARSQVRFVNTVIGKMSQVVSDPAEIKARGLVTIAPDFPRAFLVESFNRILISRVRFDETFHRGIAVFEEKDDLLPFEEAKLYGHNATHALAGYIGALVGVQRVMDLREMPGIISFLRAAFIEESGEALIRKHPGIDALFTREGYCQYADDLLERMTNPFLMDTIERVTRDPERKLGWNDRLIGTMRVAVANGVQPRRYAFGVAAALVAMNRSIVDGETSVETILNPLWDKTSPPMDEKDRVLRLIEDARRRLRGWQQSGFSNLELYFEKH